MALVRLTPQTQRALCDHLRELSRHGQMRVRTRGVLGSSPNRPLVGQLSCVYKPRDQAIRFGFRGVTYSVPVRPEGFVPSKEGEAIAWYELKPGRAEIMVHDYGHRGESWRWVELV